MRFSWILIPALGLTLAACDRFLERQSPPAEEQIQFKGSTLGCLKAVPADLGKYLRDELAAERVSENFTCLRSTLVHFNKFTRGTGNTDRYTTEEIRRFLNEALPEDRKVSGDFMAEIMKLKAVLLGGSEGVMTKSEIESARRLLDVFESEFLDLRGKMRVLLFQAGKDQKPVSAEDLKSAQRQIELSVKHLLEASRAEPTYYGFDDIQNLVRQLNLYLNDNSLLGQLLRWLPLTAKFKILFLGDKSLAYSQKDWQQILGWTVRGYGTTLEFVYWIRNLDLNQPKQMDRLIDFGDRVFDLVESSPELKEKDQLSLAAFDDVLAEVMGQGLLKTNIPLPVVKESFRMALTTMVDGPFPQRRSAFQVESLTSKHLATFRYEWNAWALTQRHLNAVFEDPAREVRYAQLTKDLNESTGRSLIAARPHLKPGESSELLVSWREWTGLMKSPRPMLWNDRDRLVLVRDPNWTRLGFPGMTKVTLLRTFTRMILRGYGQGRTKNLWDLTLSPKDFTLFQDDFRTIGHDLHALDPRSPNAAERTFKEASFFTYAGNGDGVLSSTELFEELNILAGAGGMLSTDLYNRAVNAGCAIDDVDVFGMHYLKTPCFRKVFKTEFLDLFASAPGVMALQMSMTGHVREQEFYNSLWELGGTSYSRPGLTEYGDIRIYSTILYYVEILRLIYDTNGDMKLTQEEITKAAPRFREFIAERSPLGTTMAESFFVCMVFEQRKPGADLDTAGCLATLPFGYDAIGPAELLKVLAVLKADLVPAGGFNPQVVLPGKDAVPARTQNPLPPAQE